MTIDKNKLEDSFAVIGIDRIPRYINLYLSSNRKFIALFNKYIARNKFEELTGLIHKIKGSSAVFYDEELNEILTKIEHNLLQSSQLITDADVALLKSRFTLFCQELASLKSYYRK